MILSWPNELGNYIFIVNKDYFQCIYCEIIHIIMFLSRENFDIT